MIPIRTILHPTDFSGHAEHAFHLACCLARDQGARLIVLHVGQQSPTSSVEHDALQDKLRQFQISDPNVRVEQRLEQGTPEAEIMRVASESACDLIVMGTKGKMGIGQAVLPGRWVGSVAGAVLRSATCLVMTVKSPDGGE